VRFRLIRDGWYVRFTVDSPRQSLIVEEIRLVSAHTAHDVIDGRQDLAPAHVPVNRKGRTREVAD